MVANNVSATTTITALSSPALNSHLVPRYKVHAQLIWYSIKWAHRRTCVAASINYDYAEERLT